MVNDEDSQAQFSPFRSLEFPARYDGQCAKCGNAFVAGDAVGYVDDELVCGPCRDAAWDVA